MRRAGANLLLLLLLGAGFVATNHQIFNAYGRFLLLVVGTKIALSLFYKPKTSTENDADHLYVTLIVPFFNEDEGLLEDCLVSVAYQTRPPERLHIVNDGSNTGDGVVRDLLPLLSKRMEVMYTAFEHNQGKRAALAHAFSHERSDIFVTTDSDTQLDHHALEEAVKPFADPGITAVTGRVGTHNRTKNPLTRFTDYRYQTSVVHERAAFSTMGAVLVCCGALALYRADVVREHRQDFITQRFLGQKVKIGDDRRLTNYALLHGRVVLQETAVAYTASPESLSHYIRQQVRWGRSYLQESAWIIQTVPFRNRVFWICLADLALWVIFTSTIIGLLALSPGTLGLFFLSSYFLYTVLLGWVRSTRYLSIEDRTIGWKEQAAVFFIAPFFGLLHTLLLTPVRLYSLLTLRKMGWNTRSSVEVGS